MNSRSAPDAPQSGGVLGAVKDKPCRARKRASWTALSLKRGASAIALDVHFDDGGVVDQPIDGGEGHGGIREDLIPFAEGLIGGNQDRAPLVARADELEQHAGLGLVLGDVGKIIEDQKVEAIEAID